MTPPIRKADGTGLAPNGFAEVRKGDGTVLYSAGSDIPDSVANNTVHLFDARDLSLSDGQSVSTWPDQVGSSDLSADGGPTFSAAGINGNPSVSYDGVDDGHEASSIDSTSNPTTVVSVFESNDTGSGRRNLYTLDPTDGSSYLQWNDTNWFAWNGGGITGSSDGTIQLASVIFDSSGAIREEGTETVTGSTGTRSRDGIALGGDVDNSRRYWNGDIGLVRIIDGTVPESDLAEYENILLNEWGI